MASADHGEIIGHAGYRFNDEAGRYEIVGVIVATSAQRQGLGQRLIHTICDQLHSLGANQVILYTLGHAGNEGTLSFYRHIGFQLTSFEQDFFRTGYSRVTFMKSLK